MRHGPGSHRPVSVAQLASGRHPWRQQSSATDNSAVRASSTMSGSFKIDRKKTWTIGQGEAPRFQSLRKERLCSLPCGSDAERRGITLCPEPQGREADGDAGPARAAGGRGRAAVGRGSLRGSAGPSPLQHRGSVLCGDAGPGPGAGGGSGSKGTGPQRRRLLSCSGFPWLRARREYWVLSGPRVPAGVRSRGVRYENVLCPAAALSFVGTAALLIVPGPCPDFPRVVRSRRSFTFTATAPPHTRTHSLSHAHSHTLTTHTRTLTHTLTTAHSHSHMHLHIDSH